MRIKSKARFAATTWLCAAFAFANLGETGIAQGSGMTVDIEASNLALRNAEIAARNSLARFLEHVTDEQGRAREDAAMKVIVPVENGPSEIVWIMPFATLGPDHFVGRLANAPQGETGLREGDAVHFSVRDVRDWSFTGPDGRLYGSYTTRALLPHLTEQQAAQLLALLSEQPEPASW